MSPLTSEQNVSSVTKLDVLSRLKFSSLTWPIFHFLYNLPHRTQDGPSPRELLGPFHINLSKLKWEKEKQELYVDKSWYKERVFFKMCYVEVFDLIIFIYENNEIEALKFGSESPIWKLPGVVDGHMIKPDALTSDAKGNVYVSDGTNNRILKINGLTGNVLNILLLEEKEKRIDYLLWSDTEPNLTLIHGDRINTYSIPQLS